MAYGLRLIVPPAVEPVTLDEAKLFLRVDDDLKLDDPLIQSLIKTSREYAETITRRALITQTWRFSMDAWPDDGVLRFPKSPLYSVVEVGYIDTDGDETTLATDAYEIDIFSEPGRLWPTDEWPSLFDDSLAGGWVTFVAGYGPSGKDVPEGIKVAMKLLIGHWYKHRTETIQGTITNEIPMGADTLLRSFWTGSLELC